MMRKNTAGNKDFASGGLKCKIQQQFFNLDVNNDINFCVLI